MIHRATPRFWSAYESLPVEIQRLADRSYELLKSDTRHPSPHFKKTGRFRSVRVGLFHRPLGVTTGEEIVWLWIGGHDEYERLIRSSP